MESESFDMTNERNADFWLGELLAVIHGDGGHYRAEHGNEKATKDALAKWSELVIRAGSGHEPQAPHSACCCADGDLCPIHGLGQNREVKP